MLNKNKLFLKKTFSRSLFSNKGSIMQEQGANSLPSSSERSSSSVPPMEVKGGESDEEIRRVPELGSELAGPSSSGAEVGSAGRPVWAQSSATASQRRRGRSPADKEHKRLKRLLRNRVSAQQARERKKAYLNDLETRATDLEKKNAELEQRVSTLQNENNMLRQILKNTTVGRKGSSGSSISKAEGN